MPTKTTQTGKQTPDEAASSVKQVRESVHDAQAVGDLAGLETRLDALTGTIESQLTIYAQGTGHGFVFESEHNTSCVPTCGMSFDVPTVTLTAQPDPVSTFAGWTGAPGCSTDPSCTLTLIDLNAVTVEFDPAP